MLRQEDKSLHATAVERKATRARNAGTRIIFPRVNGGSTRLCRIIKSNNLMLAPTTKLRKTTTVTSITGVYSTPTAPEPNKPEKKIKTIPSTQHGMDTRREGKDFKDFNDTTKSGTGTI